jgi:hypothetical protein
MEVNSSKKRIFLSFDFAHDKGLLDFVLMQSKKSDSPFIVIDYSRNWEPPEKEWKEKLKKNILWAEIIFIMIGKKTYKAPNVNEELEIAYKMGKPIMQFCDPGATFAECKRLPKAGKLYRWEWDNLKTLIKSFNYVSR